MSVESIAIALHHSKATGTAKLVLIGIANHDGDGGAWPTIDRLARYAAVDRRNVQRAIDKLESLGEIKRIFQAGGDHSIADHRRPNRYQFLLSCPPSCDRSKNHRTSAEQVIFEDFSTGVALASPHGGSATGRGGATATQTVPTNHLSTDQEKALDPAARATILRTCIRARHDFDATTGWCKHACGVRADGEVVDLRTMRTLVEADA